LLCALEYMSRRRPRGFGVVFDVYVSVGSHPSRAEPPAHAGDVGVTRGEGDVRSRDPAAAGRAGPPRRALLRRASDERLVELARAGDERAFEVIIERFRPALLAHCYPIAGEAAQDAVQQTFISAWSALRRGPEVRELRPWLFTIAHRAALEVLRDPARLADELPELQARGRSPEEQVEQSARVRAALAAVAGLPPRERDALVWTSIQGRSGRDTAHALGVSEGTLRQLVFRARVRARAAVSVFVPPALTGHLPSFAGHGTRRLLALGQRGLANVSSVEASDALVRLAPVLAAGVLVAAPVAAIELSGGRAPRPTARPAAALPSRQLAPTTRRMHGRIGALARALGGGAPASAPGGVPRAEGSYVGTSAGGVSRSAPMEGGEGPAPLASRGATGALPPVNAVPGGPLEPVRTGAGRHVAAVGEAPAPTVAAAQGAGSSAPAGASHAGRQALEGAEVLPAGASHAPGEDVLPPVTPTKPPVRIAHP
jgi:RNA polymerase sigma factor (sigma-70 family)